MEGGRALIGALPSAIEWRGAKKSVKCAKSAEDPLHCSSSFRACVCAMIIDGFIFFPFLLNNVPLALLATGGLFVAVVIVFKLMRSSPPLAWRQSWQTHAMATPSIDGYVSHEVLRRISLCGEWRMHFDTRYQCQ